MGFRNLHLFNLAMLGKMGWRLLKEPDALVCKVLKAKYFPHGDFQSANLGSLPSFTWRSIWDAQGLVRKGVRWKISDGLNVNIWNHCWIEDDNSFFINSQPLPGIENWNVANLMDANRQIWNVSMLEGLFLQSYIKRILKTGIAPGGSESLI